MKALKVFILTSVFLLACGIVAAREVEEADLEETDELIIMPSEGTADVAEIIALDEDVTAEDLNISEPRLLPDSPFYFLKTWGREIQSVFTFNSVKKAELREKFANEKLIELKKMVERKKSAAIIRRATENYQGEVEKIKEVTERIREKAQENPQVEKFLDKYVKHQLLHRQLLDKLETQVPTEAFEKIQEARERHLEKFGEVMTKLEDRKEETQKRLEKGMAEIKGSEFKDFKNLEVLKELEERVPEAAKQAIQQVRANTLIRLKEKIEQIPAEKLEQFKLYTEGIAGEKEKQMEILDSLREELKEKPAIKEMLIQSRERVLEKVQERTQERVREINCPQIEKPSAGFCQDGRIVVKRDNLGCVASFSCIIPAEIEAIPKPEKPEAACITLWDPVCGKNGKTYSNACFAKLANVEIAYKGKCQEAECKIDTDCPQPRCGPTGTISARCVGAKARCVEGKCQILSQMQVTPSK